MAAAEEALIQRVIKNRNNYYEVLDVPRNAPEADINRSYKTSALRLHPDKCKHPKAEEAFKILNTAKATLCDAGKRRTYDNYGVEGVKREESGGNAAAAHGFPRGAQGAHFFHFGGGHHGMHEAEIFEDIFASFFGMGPRQRRPHPQQQQQQQQHQHHHQQQQQQQQWQRQRAQADDLRVPGQLLMFLPLLFFVLFAGILQNIGDGNPIGQRHYSQNKRSGVPTTYANAVPKSIFQLARNADDGYVSERVTQLFTRELGNDEQVSYFVRDNFAQTMERNRVSQRAVDLQVLREQKAYLERRCQAELVRQQKQQAKKGSSAFKQPRVCNEIQKYRNIPDR